MGDMSNQFSMEVSRTKKAKVCHCIGFLLDFFNFFSWVPCHDNEGDYLIATLSSRLVSLSICISIVLFNIDLLAFAIKIYGLQMFDWVVSCLSVSMSKVKD